MRMPLVSSSLDTETGIVAARQRARQVAGRLGFDQQDQTRISTAVSEIARNAFRYAGGGRVEFALLRSPETASAIEVVISDRGPGIEDLDAVLSGSYVSTTGMGLGIVGAERLMDEFTIDSRPGEGTSVRMVKYLPKQAAEVGTAEFNHLAEELARTITVDPVEEVSRQNRELLASLGELRLKQEALVQLNQELEETNRGVLALYAELDEKAEHLKEAHALKTRILSQVSHEFRTPVNSMMALSRMLLDRNDGDLTDEQFQQALFINQAAGELSDLVNDLLDLARIEAGKTPLKIEEFEVEELFGTLRGMLKPLANSEAVSLEIADAFGLPPLHTDKGKLAQVLRNILSNALKFTERGWVRLTVELLGSDRLVEFTIADTGIGIAPENLQRIFDEFSQLDTPIHARAKGTGLGLSLSRRLAELLGGTITVDSELGKGTVFTLIIPSRHPDLSPMPGPAQPFDPGSGAAPNRKVLIVDDDAGARYILQRLVPEGYVVEEAEDGADAIARAKGGAPGLIILDLVMSGLDGFATLDLLKADPATAAIPVAICTSLALTPEDRARLTAADDFLSKNFLERTEVASVLERWIGGPRHD